LLATATASADPAADAANHSAAGKKAFADGNYADAIVEFRAANALQADPKLLYAIAQAQRLAGDCAAAIISYEEFIKTKADEKLVEYSQANITRCKEQLAIAPAKDPVTEPIEPIKPIEPAPKPIPIEPKPERRDGASWTGDWIGHGLAGGGVIAGAIGIVLWTGGRSDAAAAKDAANHADFVAAQAAADGAVTRQRIGIGLAVAGVAAIAVGIVHYRMAGKKEVRIGAAPAVSGGTVFAKVTF
jgi:tetratricopeptide (TPR) repeat protein